MTFLFLYSIKKKLIIKIKYIYIYFLICIYLTILYKNMNIPPFIVNNYLRKKLCVGKFRKNQSK